MVDDEPDTRELIRKILTRCQAGVTTAASATEGLELLETIVPDVIVSDIGMPEKNGYQFIREVRSRSLGNGGSIPAIALTAFARPQDEANAANAGFQAHLSKPVESGELIAEIGKLVGSRVDFSPGEK